MLQEILDSIPAKVAMLYPDGRIKQVNKNWFECFIKQSSSGLISTDYLHVFRYLLKAEDDQLLYVEKASRGVLIGQKSQVTFRYFIREGRRKKWFEVSLVRLQESYSDARFIALHFDITFAVSVSKRLKRATLFDAKSGLPNRIAFIKQLKDEIESANPHNETLIAVVCINLEHLEDISEAVGFDAADVFLKKCAKRLADTVRREDLIYQLGNSEFGLILNKIQTTEDVAVLAKKLVDSFNLPIETTAGNIYGYASLGIAIYPDDSLDGTNLLTHAESAMTRAKFEEKSFLFFKSQMNVDASNRIYLVPSLHLALIKNEFYLQFQPKVSGVTDEIVGAEALLRWRHPSRGLVMPGEFITALEETRLINKVGRWVISEVCKQVRCWMNGSRIVPRISINVSAQQLKGECFVDEVQQILSKYQLNPTCIEFELTESVLMQNYTEVLPTLNILRDMGIGLAIDDFGTGYSSLAYLSKLPFTVLKIDRSFIKDITDRANNFSLVHAITFMAHVLGLKVVAEGVETREQLQCLKEIKCDEYQGYLFSKPVDAHIFEFFLEQGGLGLTCSDLFEPTKKPSI